MPEYVYECEACNKEWSEVLKISDMDIPVESPCPDCEEEGTIHRNLYSPMIGDPVRLGIKKPPEDFREVLRKIKNSNPHHHNVKDR